MSRGWRIAGGVLAALVVLLLLNKIVLENETKSAELRVKGAEILSLQGGDLQVLDVGPRNAPPVVLIHCFSCAIDWWDGGLPILSGTHRVIALDLLGHGGSEKPSSGYSMEEQAQLVAQALARLGVERATVVGHSLGGNVAVALAEESPELVERLVILDQAPDDSYGDTNLLARVPFLPVLGEAIWRVMPDVLVREGLGQAFAPDFDVPDEYVEDFRQMTFTSYKESSNEAGDYGDAEPLDERVRALGLPLLAIFGSEDEIYDEREALAAYAALPGARTELIEGPGHSPNVETPARTARLILDFAGQAPESRPARDESS